MSKTKNILSNESKYMQAILRKCKDCTMNYNNGKVDCLVSTCPLYEYSLYKGIIEEQPKEKKDLPPLKNSIFTWKQVLEMTAVSNQDILKGLRPLSLDEKEVTIPKTNIIGASKLYKYGKVYTTK